MDKLAKRLIDKQIYRQTYRHTDKPIDIHIHNTKNTRYVTTLQAHTITNIDTHTINIVTLGIYGIS